MEAASGTRCRDSLRQEKALPKKMEELRGLDRMIKKFMLFLLSWSQMWLSQNEQNKLIEGA
ncbi:hypothetical protein QG37_07738 [Candidozyma auris]|uniref:Uncharacterized protein n=1 Tax=Candidozyma auris TaxID=498019 RepID=A0A0L0NP56_CANAR|nr:hypothetical protein QG37_07738 [[Candida] auris]